MNLKFWKSNPPEDPNEDDMPFDDVKNMFKPFTNNIDDSSPTIKSHIEDLMKTYDAPVNKWRPLFYKCLHDIGIEEVYPEAGERNTGYYIHTFIDKMKKLYPYTPIDNFLNKKEQQDFVFLFAKTMNKIVNQKAGSNKKSRKRTTRNRRRSRTRSRSRRNRRGSSRKYKK